MKPEIVFTSSTSQDANVMAMAVYGNSNDFPLPPLMTDVMKRKPHQSVIDAYVQTEIGLCRFLVAKMDINASRTKREETGASLMKKFSEGEDKQLFIDIRHMENDGLDLLTGIILSEWRFDKYRTVAAADEQVPLERITVICNHPEECKKQFCRQKAVIEGVLFARSLTSEPPNLMYPMAYAESLKALELHGVGVEILDEAALSRIGMEALLAVGKGSQRESAVAIMTWNGEKKTTQPVVIVGKGVCFDSGGLCLKPAKNQLEMKWDKSGAGVVAGLMKALALQKAPVHVIGIVGLVENMPDGNASRPGDIIRTMSGQTVEIADTDAEGRLVLADCLWYGRQRFNPSAMVDLGTLTLETVSSLGNRYGGLYSTCQQLTENIRRAGKISGDEVWELPMGDFFAKQIESPVADMKNLGVEFCGENGAAAEFLKKFVGDTPWAHIDIAGVSWTKEDLPLAKTGVTGYGVRLLEEWLVSGRF